MSNIEKISVALTPEMNARVLEAVGSGKYASANEVVLEALLEWKLLREQEAAEIDRMRKLFQEGIDSGLSPYNSMEEIIAEANRRFDLKQKKSA